MRQETARRAVGDSETCGRRRETCGRVDREGCGLRDVHPRHMAWRDHHGRNIRYNTEAEPA